MHDRKAVFHSCSSQLVKHNARPPSIEGKTVHSKPARPLSRESGTSREVAVHLSNFTPDAVRTSRYRGRAPCPIQWALSLSSCSTRPHGGLSRPPYGVGCRGAVPLDSTHYSAGCCPCQQFFEKNISAVFFKDNENARARRSSQNRRKQVKTGVLSAEKFFEKIRKTRKKDFSRRAARLFFEIFAPVAPCIHRARPSVPPICPALSRPLSCRSPGDNTPTLC